MNETLTDIVADIRAQNQGLPEDANALSPLVADLLRLADRIEKAHASLFNYYHDIIDKYEKAVKPIMDYDFGDYTTPWDALRVDGELIEGAAKTADGFPFSLSSPCEFGFDGFIEMANLIGGLQKALKPEPKEKSEEKDW